MRRALLVVFSLGVLALSGCGVLRDLIQEDEKISTSDPLYDEIDKGVVRVLSAKSGATTYQAGSGFFFDLDTENNNLYVMTNAHVVLNVDPATDYIIVEPFNYSADNTLPRLCGKIAFLNYDSDLNNANSKNIDLAVIKLTGEAPSSKSGLPDCNQQGPINFVALREQYRIFETLDNNYDLENLKSEKNYLTVGYPSGQYKRNIYNSIALNEYRRFGSDYTNNIPKYIWEYDQLIFPGKAVGGASGSLIVNKKLQVIGTLAFGYSINGEYYVGSVSYKSMKTFVNQMCINSEYKNLTNCSI